MQIGFSIAGMFLIDVYIFNDCRGIIGIIGQLKKLAVYAFYKPQAFRVPYSSF